MTEKEERFCLEYIEVRAHHTDPSAIRRAGLAYRSVFGVKRMDQCEARAQVLARVPEIKECIAALALLFGKWKCS